MRKVRNDEGGGCAWAPYKQAKTGRTRKVGDAEFINILNAQNGWKISTDNGLVQPPDDEQPL